MNEILYTLHSHRSVRSYRDEGISEETINTIVNAAQAAPSSINGQQVSIIEVRDKEKKARIAELAGGQKWIEQAPVFLLFAADFYRAKLAAEKNGVELVITQSLEAIMVGCVDVGLALGNAISVAESMGFGIVPIGGVRKEPEEIIRLLGLPEYVFPVAGLVIGHPLHIPASKPRLPKGAVFHKETYNTDLKDLIDKYDEIISKYMEKRTDGKEARSWSQGISDTYREVYYPKVYQAAKNQGYENNK